MKIQTNKICHFDSAVFDTVATNFVQFKFFFGLQQF